MTFAAAPLTPTDRVAFIVKGLRDMVADKGGRRLINGREAEARRRRCPLREGEMMTRGVRPLAEAPCATSAPRPRHGRLVPIVNGLLVT